MPCAQKKATVFKCKSDQKHHRWTYTAATN